jgi:8-oxo-dGTP pyrophosphatase MutT (NUDIX family)
MLKVADLRVDTAGGGGATGHSSHSGHELHTAWFRGIDNADEVRVLIQERLRHLKDSGLGDQEEVMDHRQTPAGLDLLTALREVYEEASALRGAVERVKTGFP